MHNEQTIAPEATIAETESQQPAAEKRPASGQEILAAIREMTERLGRYPSMPELTQAHPEIKMGTVRKYFAGYGEALREAGFEGGGCGYTVTMDALFRDWARLARKFGRCPTMSEYERDSKYSVRPLVGRFRVWSQVPRGLYGYAEREELDVEFGDVMEIIQQHYGEKLSPQRAQRNTEENKTLPLINTDSTDQKEQWADGNWQSAKPNTFETRRNGVSGGMPTEQTLPLIHGRPGQVNTDSTDQKEQWADGNWQSAKPNPTPNTPETQRNRGSRDKAGSEEVGGEGDEAAQSTGPAGQTDLWASDGDRAAGVRSNERKRRDLPVRLAGGAAGICGDEGADGVSGLRGVEAHWGQPVAARAD